MSNESVAAIDDFGNRLEALKLSIQGTFATEFAKIVPKLREMLPIIQNDVIPAIAGMTESIADAAISFSEMPDETKSVIAGLAGVVVVAGPVISMLSGLAKGASSLIGLFGTGGGLAGVSTALGTAIGALSGPIGWVILAVGGLTAASIGLINEQNNQTLMTKEQIEANKDFVENLESVDKAIENNIEARGKTLETADDEIVNAKILAEKMLELSDKENKSAAEMQILNEYVEDFNALIPNASLTIDENTGYLNLNRDAIYENIEAEKEKIRISALSELLIENAKDQFKVTEELNASQQHENELLAIRDKTIKDALESGKNDIYIKSQIIKADKDYKTSIASVNEESKKLKSTQSELIAEGNTLNGYLADPTGWDAFGENTVEATTATSVYSGSVNEILKQNGIDTGLAMTDTGNLMVNNLETALYDGYPRIQLAAWSLRDATKGQFVPLPEELRIKGYEVGQGLVNGMESTKSDAETISGGIVTTVLDTFKKGFNTQSPSKETYAIGQNVMLGFLNSLKDSELIKFTENLVNQILEIFASGNFSIQGALSFLGEGAAGILNAIGISTATASGLLWPTLATDITSSFGYRSAEETNGVGSTNHEGVDIGAAYGDTVMAGAAGSVIQSGYNGGYGISVQIDYGGGLTALFGHLSEAIVSVGQTVAAGQTVGYVGSTGNSTGPHLHYGLYQNGEAIDPTAAQTTAYTGSYSGDGSVEGWLREAMAVVGVSGEENFNHLYEIAMNESGGDPFAFNDWDSNYYAGTPSMGLMQTIEPTFDAYKIPGYDDIWNPIHNAIAAIRYMIDVYGSILNTGTHGYEFGTSFASSGLHWVGEAGPELVRFNGGEQVFTTNQSNGLAVSETKLLNNIYGVLTKIAGKSGNVLINGNRLVGVVDSGLGANYKGKGRYQAI
jgi:murein DD-endopeptidase MepM/ murein hydrolase activator NlpD